MELYDFLMAIVEFGEEMQTDAEMLAKYGSPMRLTKQKMLENLQADFKEIYETAQKMLDKLDDK